MKLTTAADIARFAHHGQKEQSTGDDYIHHVERVVGMVKNADNPLLAEVAWLHDVIEDSNIRAFDLHQAGILSIVVDAVTILTHDSSDTYETYINKIRDSKNSLAIKVKIADLQDHLRPNCPPKSRQKYERALELLYRAAQKGDGKCHGNHPGPACDGSDPRCQTWKIDANLPSFPARSSRFNQLASIGARNEHDWHFHQPQRLDKGGHAQPFEACPHVDCVMVRSNK